MSMNSLRQRITSMNGIKIPDADYLRVPAGEIRAAIAEVAELRRERDELRRERDELGARLAEIAAQPPVAWIEHELQGTDEMARAIEAAR